MDLLLKIIMMAVGIGSLISLFLMSWTIHKADKFNRAARIKGDAEFTAFLRDYENAYKKVIGGHQEKSKEETVN